ncbi:hypothetical protein BGX23_008701 [Mortierella sp. AD031]|nr:hypothetical protein BGX23_008701 [Mortierella sp. AD031]
MTTTHDITIGSDPIGVGSTLSRINICPPANTGYNNTIRTGESAMALRGTLSDSDRAPLSGCGHHLHNVQGVQEWHRLRAEMLRQEVEASYQSLSSGPSLFTQLNQALEQDDSDNKAGMTTSLGGSNRSNKVVQHTHSQRSRYPATPPIRHPDSRGLEDFRLALLNVDWDVIRSRTPAILSVTSTTGLDIASTEGACESGLSDALLSSSSNFHHYSINGNATVASTGANILSTPQEHYLDMSLFDDEHLAVDTFPSSAGMRIKPVQPEHSNPRLKFPTVYEIGSGSGRMKLLNEGRGIPLFRHPSGKVKVIQSPITEHFHIRDTHDKDDDKEAFSRQVSDLGNTSQVETSGCDHIYTETAQDSTPLRTHMTSQTCAEPSSMPSGTTTIICTARGQHSGYDSQASPIATQRPRPPSVPGPASPNSTSSPPASSDSRSRKINPYPIIIHPRPGQSHSDSQCQGGESHTASHELMTSDAQGVVLTAKSTAGNTAISNPAKTDSAMLHVDGFKSPSDPDIGASDLLLDHYVEGDQDMNRSDCQRLQEWIRSLRYQQEQQMDDECAVVPSQPPPSFVFGATTSRRTGLRRLVSFKDEVVQGMGEQQSMQRRNGKQLFDNYRSRSDSADKSPDRASQVRGKEGRGEEKGVPSSGEKSNTARQRKSSASERWKQSMETIRSHQVLAQADAFGDVLLSPTIQSNEWPMHFAAGYDPQFNSHYPSPIQVPKRTSSIASTISSSRRSAGTNNSPTRSSSGTSRLNSVSAGSTTPTRRSAGASSLHNRSSGSASPTRRSAGSASSIRRSAGGDALPSIVSILKQPSTHNRSTTNNNINNNNRRTSFPSMLRDPRVPQEQSWLIEKGVKFVPDSAPQSVRLAKTIELIRLARIPLQKTGSSSSRSRSPHSRRSHSRSTTLPSPPSSPKSNRSSSQSASSRMRTAERIQPQDGLESDSHHTSNSNSPTHESYGDIIFPVESTRAARDLTLSPPQSTRIALVCTVCSRDFQVTDQESLKAFAAHAMECEKVFKSSSLIPSSLTFQRMRTKIEETFLSRWEQQVSEDDVLPAIDR